MCIPSAEPLQSVTVAGLMRSNRHLNRLKMEAGYLSIEVIYCEKVFIAWLTLFFLV